MIPLRLRSDCLTPHGPPVGPDVLSVWRVESRQSVVVMRVSQVEEAAGPSFEIRHDIASDRPAVALAAAAKVSHVVARCRPDYEAVASGMTRTRRGPAATVLGVTNTGVVDASATLPAAPGHFDRWSRRVCVRIDEEFCRFRLDQVVGPWNWSRGQPSSANSCHSSAMPFKLCTPRSEKRRSEPTTRSLTVREA